MTFFRWSSL